MSERGYFESGKTAYRDWFVNTLFFRSPAIQSFEVSFKEGLSAPTRGAKLGRFAGGIFGVVYEKGGHGRDGSGCGFTVGDVN